MTLVKNLGKCPNKHRQHLLFLTKSKTNLYSIFKFDMGRKAGKAQTKIMKCSNKKLQQGSLNSYWMSIEQLNNKYLFVLKIYHSNSSWWAKVGAAAANTCSINAETLKKITRQ